MENSRASVTRAGEVIPRGKLNFNGLIVTMFLLVTGPTCETSTACDLDPCMNNGMCQIVLPSGDFKCICPQSFVGEVCQYPLLQGEYAVVLLKFVPGKDDVKFLFVSRVRHAVYHVYPATDLGRAVSHCGDY